MTEEIEILKKVCFKLEAAKIPYMLTGSFAANFYAIPRMTRDIDIVIEILNSDLEKFFQVFKGEFYVDREDVLEAVEHEGMFNIIHNNTVFKVDFIIRKDTTYRVIEFQRRNLVKLGENEIWIVSPEDLIISKLCWAQDSLSQMQINDVKNLIKSLKNLDKAYMHTWIETLKLTSIYEKVNEDA